MVNKSHDHDGAGWDYLIDFPILAIRPGAKRQSRLSRSLDTDPAPISCRVQVKSIWDDEDIISVRLSALSRLANDPGPSFIYIIKFNQELEPTSAHLIHLIEDNFAAVLRRLRHEEKVGTKAINRLRMTFSAARAASKLPVTGHALHEAIVSAVGGKDRLSGYIQEKQRQFNTLGYEQGAYTGLMSFEADYAAIVDASLGLRPLNVDKFQVTVTRFGIALDEFSEPITNGVVHISPTNPHVCRLIARPLDGASPITAEVEFRAPTIPCIPDEHHKMLVLGKVFTLTLGHESSGFSSNTDVFQQGAYPLDEWRTYFRLCHAASTSGVELLLSDDNRGRVNVGRIEASGMRGVDISVVNNALAICNMAKEIEELSGERLPPMHWRELEAAADEMSNCLGFQAGGEGTIRVLVSEYSNFSETPIPINYIYAFPLGTAIVGYSVLDLVRITAVDGGDDAAFDVQLNTFGSVQLLRDFEADFLRFTDIIERRTNVQAFISKVSDRACPVAA